MNYFKNLSEEQNRLNLKSEKVELRIDIKGEFKKADKKANSAIKSAQSNLTQSLGAIDDAIKAHKVYLAIYSDGYNQIAKIDKDLARGWDKLNDGLKNQSRMAIKIYEKLQSEISSIRKLVK
tara:strand:+ start:670 stop:1035 length:366 start_codon:yes stop_codon:yes gene_type:complete